MLVDGPWDDLALLAITFALGYHWRWISAHVVMPVWNDSVRPRLPDWWPKWLGGR